MKLIDAICTAGVDQYRSLRSWSVPQNSVHNIKKLPNCPSFPCHAIIFCFLVGDLQLLNLLSTLVGCTYASMLFLSLLQSAHTQSGFGLYLQALLALYCQPTDPTGQTFQHHSSCFPFHHCCLKPFLPFKLSGSLYH